MPWRGLMWVQVHPQEPAIHSCREHSALLFPFQPGAPGRERQLGPLVGAQRPPSLGSVALPIPVPLRASLPSSVKWACSYPRSASSLPIHFLILLWRSTLPTLFGCPIRSVGGHMIQAQPIRFFLGRTRKLRTNEC